MLAEEIIQSARRAAWDAGHGGFRGGFGENAVAARVLCRLARLHRDTDYTSAAVVVAGAAYAEDAARALRSVAAVHRDHPAWAADYGLALLDCFALTAHPH